MATMGDAAVLPGLLQVPYPTEASGAVPGETRFSTSSNEARAGVQVRAPV